MLGFFFWKHLGFTENKSAPSLTSTPQKPPRSDKVTVTRLPAVSVRLLGRRFFWEVFRGHPGQASVSLLSNDRQPAATRVQTVTVLLSDFFWDHTVELTTGVCLYRSVPVWLMRWILKMNHCYGGQELNKTTAKKKVQCPYWTRTHKIEAKGFRF